MRDPNRIQPFLEKIEEFWMKNPDFRFGQLIVWITRTNEIMPKFFYMEDEIVLEKLEELEKDLKRK